MVGTWICICGYLLLTIGQRPVPAKEFERRSATLGSAARVVRRLIEIQSCLDTTAVELWSLM